MKTKLKNINFINEERLPLPDGVTTVLDVDGAGYRKCWRNVDTTHGYWNLLDKDNNLMFPTNMISIDILLTNIFTNINDPYDVIRKENLFYVTEWGENFKEDGTCDYKERRIYNDKMELIFRGDFFLGQPHFKYIDSVHTFKITTKGYNNDNINFLTTDGLSFPDYKHGPIDADELCRYIISVKFDNNKYGLLDTRTLRRIDLPNGPEFDAVKYISIFEYNFIATQNKGKVNIMCAHNIKQPKGAKYLHYMFEEPVDDIKNKSGFIFITKNGQDFLLWNDFHLYNVDSNKIYGGSYNVFIIHNRDNKFNFIRKNRKGLFSKYWFDSCFDFGSDDIDNDSPDSMFPVVEYNGKFTYIDTEKYRFLFYNQDSYNGDNDIKNVRWFDKCAPYIQDKDDDFLFQVIENGKEKTLNEDGVEVK